MCLPVRTTVAFARPSVISRLRIASGKGMPDHRVVTLRLFYCPVKEAADGGLAAGRIGRHARFQRPWQRRSRPAPGSQSKKTAKMQAFSPPCVRWRSSCRHVVRQQRLTPRFKTWRRVVLVAGQLRRTASLPLLRILLSTERRMRGAGGLITGGSMKRRSSLRLHDRVSSPGFASRLAREYPTTASSRSASFTGPSKRQRMRDWPQRRRPLLWKSSCDTPKTGHMGSESSGKPSEAFQCPS